MNPELQKTLLAMQDEDQALLQQLIDHGELSQGEYHPELKALHEKNNASIKAIIEDVGWPTISLVGKEASKAAWLIVQHAILDDAFMKHCLVLLEEAVNNNEAEPRCFAYLKDRVLTREGKPQIYGTQFDVVDGKVVPFPVENMPAVNALRKNMGLDTIEEAAQRIQTRYQIDASDE